MHHVFKKERSEEHGDFAHLIPHVDFSRVRLERQFFHDGAYEVENCLEKFAAMLLLLSENAIYALSLLYEDLQAVTEVVQVGLANCYWVAKERIFVRERFVEEN